MHERDSAPVDVSDGRITIGRSCADRPADVRADLRADVSAHRGTDPRIERRADRGSACGDRDLCQRVERRTPNIDVGWSGELRDHEHRDHPA